MSDDVPRKGFFRRLWTRKWVKVTVTILAVVTPIAAYAGVRGWNYMKTDPTFCVKCHLMGPAGEKWKHSVHKEVACQTCHRANIFQEMQFGYAAFIERKREIGRHSKLDIAICQECHGTKEDKTFSKIATTPGHATHFVLRDISCLVCHVQKLHEFQPDTNACLRCHGKGKLQLEKMSTLHCLGCHDFAGERSSSLIPTAARCRECHPTERPAGAVLTTLDGKAVTVLKGHDNCLGCHKPHGKPVDDPVDCLGCHRKLLDSSSKHFKDERLQKCNECHTPHEHK